MSASLLPEVQERISRRARRVRIDVQPSGEVVLVIPQRANRQEAREFLADNAPWVRRRLALMKPVTMAPLRFDGHDQLPIADRARRLMVSRGRGAASVHFGETIELRVPASYKTPPQFERLLRRELREQARFVAEQLLSEEVARSGLKPSSLRIGDQRSLWGSCAADGTLSFNWRLLMAPLPVYRYLVVHELCHLRHRNHSANFWSLVAQLNPDCRVSQDWLQQHGHRLHQILPKTTRLGTTPAP